MANLRKNNLTDLKNHYLNLAFELAKINQGSTKKNPSVGCIVVKNQSVISSGYTSINGRPHAEFNALNKKINFKDSVLFVTLEPCSHYGKTPPCTNIIVKKGVRKVYYSIDDFDLRSKKRSKTILNNKNILVKKNLSRSKGINFYKSYLNFKLDKFPIIDAKIALSKDYYTINKKNKWITNISSRRLAHLLRTNYNALISTAKSINSDNSLLNCRINGLLNKSPDLIIIDRNLKIKKKLDIFKKKIKRNVYIYTTKKDYNKINWLRKKNIKVILEKKMSNKVDYKRIFKSLINKGYSRIYVESGLTFTNFLIKNKLLNNIYIFKTNKKLNNYGYNNISNNIIKKIKLKNKLKTYLYDDKVYMENLN